MYDRTPTRAEDLNVGDLVFLNGTSTTVTKIQRVKWAGQIDIDHTYGGTWRSPDEMITVLTWNEEN